MDNDDKMGSKAYAWFDHTFMLFGSLCKSFAPGTPIEDWQGWADQWFDWAKDKAKELVEEAYNGKEPEPATEKEPQKDNDEPEEGFVSAKQAKRFYGIAYGEGGYTKEGIDRLLNHYGCKSAYKIKERMYEELCQMARSKILAIKYNKEPEGKEF